MTIATAERVQADTVRCLRTIASSQGRVALRHLTGRHGLGPATVQRHLRHMETVGLIATSNDRPGTQATWRITDLGRAYLKDVTAGLDGSRFDLHPADRKDQ